MGYSAEDIIVTIDFEVNRFQNFIHETSFEEQETKRLFFLWKEFVHLLHIKKIYCGDKEQYLVLWLDDAVSKQIEVFWEESAYFGFLAHSLAQFLCMETIHTLLPEALAFSCTPTPKISDDLYILLQQIGIKVKDNNFGQLAYQYAVFSFFPFQSTCAVCTFRAACPNKKMKVIPTQ